MKFIHGIKFGGLQQKIFNLMLIIILDTFSIPAGIPQKNSRIELDAAKAEIPILPT